MSNNSITALLENYIERNKEEIFNRISELIQLESITGNEGTAQEYMEALYKDIGLDVYTFEPVKAELKKETAYCEVDLDYKNRPNVIGTLNNGDKEYKSIILNGHVDVVPVEDVFKWEHDPWAGKIDAEYIHGRGSLDMKAGLIVNYYAIKSLMDIGKTPKGKVILESVIEEEAGGGGTLSCLMNDIKADAIVICEPTNMDIVVAHAGVIYFRVKVKGRAAHAQFGHHGINAIEKMNKICDSLFALDKKRGEAKKYDLFEQHSGRSCHLIIGKYSSGQWPSSVPDYAEIDCRISFIPGESETDIKKEVEGTIMAVAQKDEWLAENSPQVEWYGWHGEPWEEDLNSDLIRSFKQIGEGVLQRELKFAGHPAGMDNRFAKQFNIPSLAFGPRGKNMHGANEYVEKESILSCIKTIASFIHTWSNERGAIKNE